MCGACKCVAGELLLLLLLCVCGSGRFASFRVAWLVGCNVSKTWSSGSPEILWKLALSLREFPS